MLISWQIWVPILSSALPSIDINKKYFPFNASLRRNLLSLLRTLGEYVLLAHFDLHTEFTLELLEDVLKRLSKLEHAVAPVLNLNLETFKNHFIYHHLVDSIRDKGPICNTDTGFGEARHRQSKQDYAKSNKRPDQFEVQLMRKVLEREVIVRIDTQVAAMKLREEELLQDESGPTDEVGNVKLGARQKRRPLSEIVSTFPVPSHISSQECEALERNLCRFLSYWILSFQGAAVHLDLAEYLASEYLTAQVSYVSLLDNSLVTNRIRFNPCWNKGGPRYDYILYNADHNSYGYGQVLSVFAMVVNRERYSIALLLDLKKKAQRSSITGFIEATADKTKASSYRFVMTNTFVRPLFVHPPDPDSDSTTYVVNDLIDYDSYLRFLNIK
ncbi:hypothetical protein M408DRAFT_295348 [Serendipita vermifera MAFF 305830]|uniref:Uncharacterized protein n=1 Tax=Serendipita vermifera MAFF 305830 TaxID=933852 RepID=A0A0C3B0D0_SERVB|nr:hypothetical protein M408DRAFT_295348 [Serendipita vermifera MAFF 305830]